MAWSKTKQVLESFLTPSLVGRVEYRATSYRYAPDKLGRSYITVDKKEVFNMCDIKSLITWYKTEQEIKADPNIKIPITVEDIEAVRKDGMGSVPEERLAIIARTRKISEYAKAMMKAQGILSKSDFYKAVNEYLSSSVENSLASEDILMNIFAIVDRRVGKKRLLAMESEMQLKHPIVQYFYRLRRE